MEEETEAQGPVENMMDQIVRDSFASVALDHYEAQRAQSKDAWALNRASLYLDALKEETSIPKMANATSKMSTQAEHMPSFSWHNLPKPQITSTTKWIKQGTYEVPIIMIPKATPVPPLTSWNLTRRNFRGNEDLFNLPYFDDDVHQHDKNLVNEIEGVLAEQVIISPAPNIEVDEKILYDAVDKLMGVINQQKKQVVVKVEATSEQNGPVLPSMEIFNAVTECFPKFGTAMEARNRYMKQFRKRHPNTEELDLPDIVEMIPNIDDDSTVITSFHRDQTLGSYRKLFCRRCFVYDCLTHDEKDSDQFISPEFMEKSGPFKVEQKACGEHCYSNWSPQNVTSTSSNRKKSHTSRSVLNENKKSQGWKPAEISLFRALKDVFPGNYCSISKIISKQCIQVYELALAEDPDAIVLPIPANSSDIKKIGNVKKPLPVPSKGQRTGMVWGHLSSQDIRQITRNIYKPCFHPGIVCGESDICSCKASKTPCEKYCACAADCKHRYVGCRCNSTCNYKSCPCFAAYRECDADLCSTCGACEYETKDMRCKNICIQKMLSKKLRLAKSDIPDAGWGIFAGEPIFKNDFISEYVGEIITSEEGDRRALENKARCHTYLFEMNDRYTLDARRYGSKIRFANHSDIANADFKLVKVNTDHRIGIYANRNIEPGEEIFLSYEGVISEHHEVADGRKKKKKAQPSAKKSKKSKKGSD